MGGTYSSDKNKFFKFETNYNKSFQNVNESVQCNNKASSLRRWKSLTRASSKRFAPQKKSRSELSLDKLGRRRGPIVEEDLQVVPVKLPNIPDEEKGTCFVHLLKKDGIGLGITVSGGSDKGGGPRVSNLRGSGIGARSDMLQVGDFITSVNGIRTNNLKHGEIISLLKNIGEKVSLEIEYRLPPITVKTATIVQKTTQVTLKKVDNSFGFIIRGGYSEDKCKSRPLVVTHIRVDGPADKNKTIITGDRIISINGDPLSNLTCEAATTALKNLDEEAVFTIEYDVSVMDAVSNASGPLLVEVCKTPGADLGINLVVSTHRKKSVICIEKITMASIADRCGALHVGDQVLSIDGVVLDMTAVSLEEASKLLKSTSDQVRLEILPVSHLAIEAPKCLSPNRFAPTISSAQSLSALNSFPRRHGTFSTTSTFRTAAGSNRWSKKKLNRPNKYSASATHLYSSLPRTKKAGGNLNSDVHLSLTSMDYLSGNQVVHTESLEITLLTADDNSPPGTGSSSQFGIQLQGGIFSTEVLTCPPVIAFVELDSAADNCGLIQAGDRLLSVNGCTCEDSTLDEVNHMLSDAMNMGQVLLETEFDVAESVVPSSGTFHVKVPKKRGIDLASGKPQAGEPPLYISEVKIGSVAHRTGTLQEGDRLMAIDGVRLDRIGCTVENAMALLDNAEDLVRLKIKKDEENSDDAETSGAISYTVELKRYGGPLGITISGTEEPFDPITISGLNPGGLAARTGAIHEGDHILTINNISLRAKPLSEAIQLLRSAGEVVTLKIKKPVASATETVNSCWNNYPTSGQRVHSATMPRHHVMGEITELSDPEDDILPPPMEPVPPFSQARTTPFSVKTTPTVTQAPAGDDIDSCGTNTGAAGAPSVDSAMGSWDGDGHKTTGSDLSDSNTQSTSLSPTSPSDLKPQIRTPSMNSTTERQRRDKYNSKNIESLRAKFEAGGGLMVTGRVQMPVRRHRERYSNPSLRSRQDWQNALEDLQSVGQAADVVRDLEESIMNTSKLSVADDSMLGSPNNLRQATGNLKKRSHSAVRNHDRKMFGSHNDALQTPPSSLPPQKTTSSIIQLHKLILMKEDSEEFGFSLSDGQLERGVFVHSMKPSGPAERAGARPYDRVLQINNTRTRDFDCCQAVPLISSSGNRIELVIARNSCNTGMTVPLHQPPLLAPPVNVPSADSDSLHAL